MSWVYFIQAEHGGPVKIGWSLDPERRLASIQTGNPFKLVIRRLVDGGGDLEYRLHQRFNDHRLEGEWFEPCPGILDIIETGETLIAPPPQPEIHTVRCAECWAEFEAEKTSGLQLETVCRRCVAALAH